MKRYIKSLSKFLICSFLMLMIQVPQVSLAQAQQDPKNSPVTIIAPQNDSTAKIGDTINIMIVVKSGKSVESVAVISGEGLGIGMTSSTPYVVKWDTANVSPGEVTLKAQAHMADGSVLESPLVKITLESPSTASGVQIKEGTPVIIRTEEEMISGRIPKGTTIIFRVEKDVIDSDGQVLIPQDSAAYGEVLESRSHGMFGRPGKLDFKLESVNGAGGASIPIRAVRSSVAKDKGALVVVGGALLSVFFVFFRGNNVEIPKGTVFTAYVNNDTLISEPLPPRLSEEELNIERSATITKPVEGANVEKAGEYDFSYAITPSDESVFVRLYVNEELVMWEKGNLTGMTWKTPKAKDLKAGEHTVYLEVTFDSGHIVKSPTVTFTVE